MNKILTALVAMTLVTTAEAFEIGETVTITKGPDKDRIVKVLFVYELNEVKTYAVESGCTLYLEKEENCYIGMFQAKDLKAVENE